MSYKKRILFIGESSHLNTGFSNDYRNLIPRLVETGKFEIAEIGSYTRQDDKRAHDFVNGRWKWYGNMPTNEQDNATFNQPDHHPRAKGQNTNQFGYNIFDRVCAEFQPDIVVAIRDFWHDEKAERSPFREWYKFIWKFTVDAFPQAEEWMSVYENVDVGLGYSDFGIDTIKRQSPKVKMFPKPLRPGIDLDLFKPLDRAETREKFNLSEEPTIIGMVARNQSRKLILDLIDAFALMKNKYPEEKVQKAALLLHSCWPDNAYSFDYPRHVKRLQSDPWMPNYRPGIMQDVLQTVKCHSCSKTSINFAANLYNKPLNNGHVVLPCPYCQQQSATCPNTSVGYTREELVEVYNLMDIYVQSAICEGDGMPMNEAKACGKPVIGIAYSAMKEKLEFPNYKHLEGNEDEYTMHLGGVASEPLSLRHEPETGCLRAVANVEDLADKLYDLVVNDIKRKKLGQQARESAEKNFDWNNIVKEWEFIFDNISTLDRS
jgi:glycosyltransferase involved in cell wall biosynthesis